MPDVSIIIPCFNQGQYIHEAIDSVVAQTHQDFEIIIVNDGSTDIQTIDILRAIDNPSIRVIHTSNQGLASARNNGIREAQAEIILPLDSDDKIFPQYVEKALGVLKNDPATGIVYCNAELFGARKGKWALREFSVQEILFRNLIFHCAFFRRQDWEKTGGYNPNMIYGWEDWDFWLSIISLGRKVFHIPEVLHSYRVRKKSMVHVMTEEQKVAMHARIFLNHQQLYSQYALDFFEEINRRQKSILDILLKEKICHPIQALKTVLRRFHGH
jgi:glycosyltransferase involved in cell wall biosynthesis